jgi:hypothetical protein
MPGATVVSAELELREVRSQFLPRCTGTDRGHFGKRNSYRFMSGILAVGREMTRSSSVEDHWEFE